MNNRVLVLDASYTPLGVVPWEQAIILLLDEKARMVTEYAGRFIHSANLVMPWPAVVALVRTVGRRRRVRFNRMNVLARDRYTCLYCGTHPMHKDKPDLSELTLDHVVPRAQSRDHQVVLPWNRKRVPVTCWENIVTCCVSCNGKKADRTPGQAGMKLMRYPKAPSPVEAFWISIARLHIPDEWMEWVPEEAAPWRDYWTVDLDEK